MIAAVIAIVGVVVATTVLAASATGLIEGTIKNEAGTEPLKGVEACALKIVNESEAENSKAVKCVKSNSEGHYVIEGLPGGEYFVEFPAKGDPHSSVTEYYAEEHGGDATTDQSEAGEVEAEGNYEPARGINAKIMEFGASNAG